MLGGSLALVAVAACSDGDSAVEPTAGAESTRPPNVVPAPEITVRPTTMSTQSTVQPMGTVATTRPSSPGATGGPPATSPEEAVQAAVGRAERTFLDMMRDPNIDVDDGVAAIHAVTAPGSAARSSFESTYQSRRALARFLVANQQAPFAISTEGEVLLTPGEAFVQVCLIDSDIIVGSQLNADGDTEQRVVGDDVVTARREAQRFVLSTEGQWQLANSNVIAQYPGETACPPE